MHAGTKKRNHLDELGTFFHCLLVGVRNLLGSDHIAHGNRTQLPSLLHLRGEQSNLKVLGR